MKKLNENEIREYRNIIRAVEKNGIDSLNRHQRILLFITLFSYLDISEKDDSLSVLAKMIKFISGLHDDTIRDMSLNDYIKAVAYYPYDNYDFCTSANYFNEGIRREAIARSEPLTNMFIIKYLEEPEIVLRMIKMLKQGPDLLKRTWIPYY